MSQMSYVIAPDPPSARNGAAAVAVPAHSHARAARGAAFRSDIEGLRGIAVLIVVAFHCGITVLPGGFIGVDVFFVLSGYLITGLLVTGIEKDGGLDLLQFYARRARRLLPAAALTLLVTLLVSMVVLAPQELMFTSRAARATAVYLSNMFFAVNAADYFSADVETNPLLHTWSLAVEEQFYLFWPLLILLSMKARSRRGLIAALWVVTAVSLAACAWFSLHATSIAFYSLPTRAWEFSAGGLASVLPVAALRTRAATWVALSWLGVALIVASAVLITEAFLFPGWVVLVPVAGTLIALVAGAQLPSGGARRLLDSAPLQFLGTLSYSWYLWHWPFLVFTIAVVPHVSIAGKVVAALLALGVAVLAHRFVENPIRFNPFLVKRPGLSVGIGVVLTVSMLFAGIGAVSMARRIAASPEMKGLSAAADDIGRMPREQCVALATSASVKTCVFGDPASATNIVLFGDSHAIQWFNPLERLATSRGWRLTTLVKSGCPAADVEPAGSDVSMNDGCVRWRRAAIQQIVAARPALVVVGSSTTYLGLHERTARATNVSLADWGAGTRRTVSALTSAGLQVALMRDTPLPSFDVPTCLARQRRQVWSSVAASCDTDVAAALHPAAAAAEQRGVQDLPLARFVDLSTDICPGGVCRGIQDGSVTYRDDNHLTGGFADTLAPVLEARLVAILNRREDPLPPPHPR